jgi:hypothetical protein
LFWLPWFDGVAVAVAVAEPVQVHADYSVSLVGLPVAYLSFVTEIDGASYHVSGTLRTSALSDIVSRTRGTPAFLANGTETGFWRRSFPSPIRAVERRSGQTSSSGNGNVKSTTHDPKRKARGATWVPLLGKDLRSVLDPLSGLMFPAGSKVCPRSLPIFDGQSRVTLHLSPKGDAALSSQGLQG